VYVSIHRVKAFASSLPAASPQSVERSTSAGDFNSAGEKKGKSNGQTVVLHLRESVAVILFSTLHTGAKVAQVFEY
jgi:hypothetical protein